MTGEKRTVSLPAELYAKIEQTIVDTEFRSVDAHVSFAPWEVVKEAEPEVPLSEQDEEQVKKRLRGLGYLD